jgi:hypothetical protein
MRYATPDIVESWIAGDIVLANRVMWVTMGYGLSRRKASALRSSLPSHTPCGRVVTTRSLVPMVTRLSALDRSKRAAMLRELVTQMQGVYVPHPSDKSRAGVVPCKFPLSLDIPS